MDLKTLFIIHAGLYIISLVALTINWQKNKKFPESVYWPLTYFVFLIGLIGAIFIESNSEKPNIFLVHFVNLSTSFGFFIFYSGVKVLIKKKSTPLQHYLIFLSIVEIAQIFLEINSEYLIWRAFFISLVIVFLCILVMVQLYFSKESIEEFLLFCLILLCASGMALRGLVILKNNLNLDILKGMDDAIPFLIFTLSVNSVTITIIIITINKLNKELRKLADIDPLTGLFNRRALFDSAVPSLEKRYQPEDYFGIGLLDLDNFKKINDKYGHAAGDFVLVQFSDIILKQIRKFDIVARFGGEEFVVLIIDKDKNSIKEVFENIRSSLESTDIQFQNYTFHATVSIGMLIKNGNDFIFEECLHFADKALYKAKAKGRNCIVVKEA